MKPVYGSNHYLARLIIEELRRCGVDTFCISPGARSQPLALAVAEQESLNKIVHFDERGSAFYALGYGKVSRRPAALICTSGTAVANYYPAVLEASVSNIPLIVITADRPGELQDAAANQTFNQINFFGENVRWSHSFFAPDQDVKARSVLTAIDQAVYRCLSPNTGPVHLNVRFRKPLLTETSCEFSVPADDVLLNNWCGFNSPFTTYEASCCSPAKDSLKKVINQVSEAKRGVIFVGELSCREDADAVKTLGRLLRWPIITEVTSQFGSSEPENLILRHAHLYFRNKQFAEQNVPDFVLQFGREAIRPSNAAIESFEKLAVKRLLVTEYPNRQDPASTLSWRIVCSIKEFCSSLVGELSSSKPSASELCDSLETAEKISAKIVAQENPTDKITELQCIREIFADSQPSKAVFLSNSLPVRLASWFVGNTKTRFVFANRGLGGIDGTIASAIGGFAALNCDGTVICGDLAFLHDANSLALLKAHDHNITFVVINNDGGGIFSLMPNCGMEQYHKPYVITPHGYNFANLAEMFGLNYQHVDSLNVFRESYRGAIAGNNHSIIEVCTDRDETAECINLKFSEISKAIER